MTVAGARPLRSTDPATLGGIELVGRLGEGGMGVVYLGRTPEGTSVAVKAIRADLAGEPGFRRRFRGEVERARQVPPYCTAEVLAADPDSDPPYLVVEYVDGPSLSEVVGDRGPLTAANLHSVAIGVATALTAIHGAGVIHRDLKPANVLLAPGSLKVIDFGIARPVADASTLTDANEIVGTVAYMAPERFGPAGSKSLTPATDVFAWGAVVAYAGTGRVPFLADSMPAMAMRIMHDPPDLDGLPPALRDLVGYALAKEPAERPTARQLLEMLTSAETVRTPVAAPRSPEPAPAPPATAGSEAASTRLDDAALPPAPRRRSRWGVPVGVLAALLTLVLAGAIATGTVRLPFLHPSASASATGSASSPTSPTGSPSASAPTWTGLLTGMSLVVADPLTSQAHWTDSSAVGGQLACELDHSGLLVTRSVFSSFRCQGPTNLLRDTAVSVEVTLLDQASCAGIWLRFDRSGYVVQVCADGYHVAAHGRPDGSSLTKVCDPVPSPLAVNRSITVGVVLRDNTFTFFRDGRPIGGCVDENRLFAVGHDVLGIFPQSQLSSAAPASRVRLRNVEIYGGTG